MQGKHELYLPLSVVRLGVLQTSLADNLKFTLVRKFTNGCPNFSLLKQRFAGFGLSGPYRISLINYKHIAIRLSNMEDYSRMWTRQVWLIDGVPMRIFKWTPDFDPKSESSIAPVWVGFSELPLHLFNCKALFELASLVGKPIKLDEPTADQPRPSVARVRVEIDLLADHIYEVATVTTRHYVPKAVVPATLCCPNFYDHVLADLLHSHSPSLPYGAFIKETNCDTLLYT